MTSLRKRVDVQLMREAHRVARAPIEEFIARLGRLRLPADLILPSQNRAGSAKAKRKRPRKGVLSVDVEPDPGLARGPLRLVRSDRRLLINGPQLNVNRIIARYENFLAENGNSHFSERALRIKAALCERLGYHIFQTWFASLEFEEFAHGVVYASVSTRFVRRWISGHYYEALLYCCRMEFPAAGTVEISVRPPISTDEHSDRNEELSERRLQSLYTGPPRPRPRTRAFVEGSPLDPRRTLETFVVTPGNRSAHAAALGIVEGATARAVKREPVYFHGAAGAGKTHLLHAVVWEAQRRNPEARILYLSAERFRAMFIASVRRHEPQDFIRNVCTAETLMIDGLDLLYGEQSIEALDHIVELLVGSGHQLVAASRSSLADIRRFGESLRRQLLRGRVATVDAVDGALKHRAVKHPFDIRGHAQRELFPPVDVAGRITVDVINYGQEAGGIAHAVLLVQWEGDGIAGLIDRAIVVLLADHSQVGKIASPPRRQLAHAHADLGAEYTRSVSDIQTTIRTADVIASPTSIFIDYDANRKGQKILQKLLTQPGTPGGRWRDDSVKQQIVHKFPAGPVRLEDLRVIAGLLVKMLGYQERQPEKDAREPTVIVQGERSNSQEPPKDRGSPRLGLVSRIDEGLELEVFEIGGKIKFFDHTKGYGFIRPDSALPDVLLHWSCLRAGGYQQAPEGARVRCQVLKRARGLQAFRILDMDVDPPSGAASVPVRSSYVAPEPQSEWERAVVEWFDRERGHGFLKSMSDGCAIFVHGGVLLQSGFATLRPRERLEVRWGSSAGGRVAVDLRPAGAWDEHEPRNAGDGC